MDDTASAAAASSQKATGLTLMAIAMLAVPVMDAIAKYLSTTIPPLEISLLRFVVPAILLFPVVLWRVGWRGLIPPDLLLHVLRGAGIALATVFFFTALRWMPMADAAAIFFIEPLILTLFSAIFLGEKIGWRRVLAVAIGFCGALIVIRPSFTEVGAVALMPVGAAVSFSAYVILTKIIAQRENADPWVMQFMAGISGVTLLGAMILFGMTGAPLVMPTPFEAGLVLFLGLMAIAGHSLIIMALQRVEAASVAPFSIWRSSRNLLGLHDLPRLSRCADMARRGDHRRIGHIRLHPGASGRGSGGDMSGKIVNLRQARKRKAREDSAAQATENAARHGQSKAVRSLADARAEKERRDLDGKKRD